LLRDRSNGTRGQAAPANCTVSGFRHLAMRIFSDPNLAMQVARMRTWRMRTVPRFSSRADSERSPLHDVKQHAHGRANPNARESSNSFWTSSASPPRARAHATCAHWRSCRPSIDRRSGGARRDRTDDLLLAKQALSQLSYGPFRDQISEVSNQKHAQRPSDY
jgi:hypothetical protein